MSSSPRDAQEESEEKQNHDELDEQPGGDTEGEAAPKDGEAPPRRGRGRPKGSKNKRPGVASSPAAAGSSTAVTPRKRGRPPKVSYLSIIFLVYFHPLSSPLIDLSAGEES
ncbi:hypothetical protein FPV67DRAFT_1463888 [Lyophyllum atratum]|nr:hypothetical protein FPV67DRAFT_1463888 [Lyophyllum atratum]